MDGSLEPSSFADLYRTHAGDVYRFALYLSGDPALAEDIVSETFLRYPGIRLPWFAGRPFGDTSSPSRAISSCTTCGARADRNHWRTATPSPLLPCVSWRPRKISPTHWPPFRHCLRQIGRHCCCTPCEGIYNEEIARVLGLSLSAVKVKIHRARLFLAERRKGVVPCR